VSKFYGTDIENWAGFGPIGNIEKKNWADYEQLFFMFSWDFFFLNIVASALKSCIK
jgi:hypothetical protein